MCDSGNHETDATYVDDISINSYIHFVHTFAPFAATVYNVRRSKFSNHRREIGMCVVRSMHAPRFFFGFQIFNFSFLFACCSFSRNGSSNCLSNCPIFVCPLAAILYVIFNYLNCQFAVICRIGIGGSVMFARFVHCYSFDRFGIRRAFTKYCKYNWYRQQHSLHQQNSPYIDTCAANERKSSRPTE